MLSSARRECSNSAIHIAYGSAKGIFYACNLATAHTTPVEKAAFYGIKIHPLPWQPEALWQFKTSHHGQPGGTVIKAGKRLYGYAGSTLIALENLDKQPRLAWERQLAGRPTSLVAADHKLFVATAEGTLYCFGQPSQPPTAAKTYAAEPLSLEARPDAWSAKAGQIVKTYGGHRERRAAGKLRELRPVRQPPTGLPGLQGRDCALAQDGRAPFP
jgi:hypothetical protein